MERLINKLDLAKHWIFPFSVLGIIIGLYFPIISAIVFAVQACWIFFADDEDIAMLMFFTLPFAALYKMAPGSMTFFTFLEIWVIIILMSRTKKCNSILFILTVIFGLYTIITPSRNLEATIKLIVLIFLFYYLTPICKKSAKSVIIAFTTSVLLSSCLSLMRGILPVISSYVAEVEDYTVIGMIDRFAGLYADPNYYSANIILCKFALLMLYHNKKIKTSFWVYSIALSVFGFMTVSKTFLAVYIIYLITLIFTEFKDKKYFFLFTIFAVIIAAFWIIQNSNETFFVNLRARFAYDDINGLTTGRIGIGDSYLHYIFSDWKTLLFGRGLGADLLFVNGKYIASHNSYIDLLYYFGIVGSILFALIIGLIISLINTNRRRIFLQYMTLASIAIMYFSLSILLFIDFPFHLILIFSLYNMEE